MKAIRSHYLTRRLCLALVLVMFAGVMPAGLSSALAQEGQTVLVFPVEVAAENAPRDIGSRASGSLTMAIDDVAGMDALQFSSTSPSVRRAVSEGRIRQIDVEEGVADLGTALVIGNALRAEYVVLSSIQSYTRKDDPSSAEVLLAGQMYSVPANLNPATGEPVAEPKVFRAFGVSGTSSPRAHYTGPEGALVQEAVRDAASKAALTLSGRAAPTEITTKPKKSSKSSKYLLLGLALVGLLVAVNSGNSGGGGAPADGNVAPAFLAVEDVDGTVHLEWPTPTGTTLTLLGYQLERRVDSGSWVVIASPSTLPATRTFYNDSALQSGRHAYQYRIRAVYASGPPSPATISGVVFVTR